MRKKEEGEGSQDEETETPRAIGCPERGSTARVNADAAAREADSGRGKIERLHGGTRPDESKSGSSGGKSSDPYLVTEWPHATKAQVNFIRERLGHLGPEHRQWAAEFMTHLFACSVGRDVDEFVPVPAWLMREQITDCPRCTEYVWRPLARAGLIDVKEDYSYVRHVCREFRIDPRIAAQLAARGQKGKANAYDLATGKRKRGVGPRLRTCRSDRHGNRIGGLVGEALDYYARDGARHLINLEAARDHVAELDRQKIEAKIAHVADWTGAGERRYLEASGRFMTDVTALQVIRGQNLAPAPDMPEGIYEYVPAYEIQELSGRVSFRNGGPQSASRRFKDAAYRGIPGLHNYDIRSCHTAGLYQLARRARADGVDVSLRPLTAYLERGGKDRVAKERRLPRSLVKRVEHAVKYGGWLPPSMKSARHVARDRCYEELGRVDLFERYLPEVARLTRKHVGPGEVDEALAALREEFRPIREMVTYLADYLAGAYWEKRRRRGGKGGWHMKNAAGVAISPHHEYEEGHERRSKLMAWHLQGLESAYVHALTVLGEEHGYEPIGNEHDGLITIGRVPEAAQAEARKMSGFEEAELVEKWFVERKTEKRQAAKQPQAA